MILFLLISTITIYVTCAFIIFRRIKSYCAADIGFIFLSLCFLYTVTPAFVFAFLDVSSVPGWPWAELNSLNLTESSITDHLWRHNFFIVVFTIFYVLSRGRVSINLFAKNIQTLDNYIGSKDVIFLSLIYIFSSLLAQNIIGNLDSYVDKYLVRDTLGQNDKIVLAIVNRLASGTKFILILAIAFLPIKRWIKLFGLFMLILITVLQSSGARIDIYFVFVGSGVAYVLIIKQIKLRFVFLVAAFGMIASMFIEIFRFYDFDFSMTLNHIETYGIKPMGELGAVFFTGAHLYSLSEFDQLPRIDWRMFFYEFISLFVTNSNTEFNPQYWYWNTFYPEYLVPPQTNGPIADSALWGMGIIDLGFRAAFIGGIFGFLAKKLFVYKPSFYWFVIYVFFCSTCIMNLKYGVFWQLNPLVKTILPILGLLYFYRYLSRGLRGSNNIRI
jgi:hypothetical protein